MKNDHSTNDTDRFEYRAFGVTFSGWRRTEWKDYESALEDYERAKSEWDGHAIERRIPGDDKTIQRKQSPESDEWTDVTDEITHFVDEEVKAA